MKNIFIILLCLCSGFTFAQKKSDNKQAQKFYDQAGQSIAYRFYDKALEQLKQATEVDPGFASAWQQIGDINRKLQNYPEAIKNYQKVLSIDPEFSPLTHFALGESELNTGEYQKALERFKKYATTPNLPDKSKQLVAKYIADCEFGIAAVKNPVDFKPQNLGSAINSPEPEYLPVVTADEETIIYTRKKNNNEDFYKSSKKGSDWQQAGYLSKNINTDSFNEGAQCISPDGMYLFFTGCNRPDGLGRCDIYVCRREGKDWSKPHNIGAPINTSGWESQPSLSADGRTLYFVSTRPGGIGGYDLYKTELGKEGSWDIPVNMGPSINTPFDEQSPFIHPDDQTFYFSSNGWPGLGNKDIFLSRKDVAGTWTKPINLGYPINTFKEESSLTISSDGKTAFFASDKAGGQGALDIYSFELNTKLRPQPVTYVKGTVFDKASNEKLEAKVEIVSLNNNKIAFEDNTDPESGEFLATMPVGKTFALNVSKEGYLFYSENFSLKNSASAGKPFKIDVLLQKIEIGGKVVLNNIFFETGKFNLLPESKVELDQLITFLTANPKISIEIGGYTDNVGDDKSNLTLSENRAKTVHNYLLSNKIAAARLTFKGYGETGPVAGNTTEEGRQKNRRTEFKIVKM